MKYDAYYNGKHFGEVKDIKFNRGRDVFVVGPDDPVYFDTAPQATKIKIKRLHPYAKPPQYATSGAAGFDLVAIEDVVIEPGETEVVRTGLAFEIPEGYEMQIRPRSGVSLKTPLRIANSPGTIDSDFRGEVGVLVWNSIVPDFGIADLGEWVTYVSRDFFIYGIDGWTRDTDPIDYPIGTYRIHKGDRIAQGVIAPVVRAQFDIVDELSETDRGEGGFGSTGV